MFHSVKRSSREEDVLPAVAAAWRSTLTHLKIYFQKVPEADEAEMEEKKMPLGITMKTKNQKGQIICIPWEKCAVYDSDTSEISNDKKPLAMTISYDSEVDCLAIKFFAIGRDSSLRSRTDDNIFIFDVDAKKQIVSIEVLDASCYLDLTMSGIWEDMVV